MRPTCGDSSPPSACSVMTSPHLLCRSCTAEVGVAMGGVRDQVYPILCSMVYIVSQLSNLCASPGPNDLSLFQPKCHETRDLALRLFVYYHAKACRDGRCTNLSTSAPADSHLSGEFTGQHYVTRDITVSISHTHTQPPSHAMMYQLQWSCLCSVYPATGSAGLAGRGGSPVAPPGAGWDPGGHKERPCCTRPNPLPHHPHSNGQDLPHCVV